MRNEFDKAESEAAGRHAECVWMLAGVVDYKLCDRDFDCESCPLDQAFRDAAHAHRASRPLVALESGGADLREYQIAPMLFYHPGHVWARIEEEGTVRVGLDDFGQSLTGRIYAVDLPREGAQVEGSRSCWRIAHQAGETALAAPVTGTVHRVNNKLTAHPSLLNRDPYSEGWALIIKPDRLEECLKQLYYGRKVELWYRSDIQRLYQSVADALPASTVGVTMQDGGSRINDFTSLLTADQMRQVIDSFLSVPSAGAGLPVIGNHQGR